MHNPNAVALTEFNDLGQKIEFHALRRRVRRETQNHHLGARHGFHNGALKLCQKVDARNHFDRTDVCARNNRTVDMNGIRRVRHEHRVATIRTCKHQVCNTFFGADRHDGFLIGIDVDVELTLIPIADCFAQTRNAFGNRVAVRIVARCDFNHLIDNMFGSRTVGVTHRKVNDVFSSTTRCHLESARNVEDIRRQPFDARKVGIHMGLPEIFQSESIGYIGRY